MRCILFFLLIVLTSTILSCKKQAQEESIEEQKVRMEVQRRSDSLLAASETVMKNRNLSDAFAGTHLLHGSGNPATDAHQDPAKQQQLMRAYAKFIPQGKEAFRQAEENRRKMRIRYQDSIQREKENIY